MHDNFRVLLTSEMEMYPNHNTIQIVLMNKMYKLHFEQMGMPIAAPEQPTTSENPLLLCTDGSWKDFGKMKSDPSDLLVCPVGSWAVAILDDKVNILKPDQRLKEADLRFDIIRSTNIKVSSGPVSGWHSGRVYICELVAIATAALFAPANWHIKIISDSKAAVEAIQTMINLQKESQRKKLCGYWILKAIIWAINSRKLHSGSTEIQWIKAHSDEDNLFAFGNRIADTTAKHFLTTKFSNDYRQSRDQMTFDPKALSDWNKNNMDTLLAYTAAEYFLYKHSILGHAVLGNVRDEILKWERGILMDEWKTHKQQSIHLRRPGSLEAFQAALLLMWRHSVSCTFIIMAATNTLQYGDSTMFNKDDANVWTAQLVCSTCECKSDFDHIFGDCGISEVTDLRLEMIHKWEQFTNNKSRPGNSNVMAAVQDVSNDQYDLTCIGIFDLSMKQLLAQLRGTEAVLNFQQDLLTMATRIWKISKQNSIWPQVN